MAAYEHSIECIYDFLMFLFDLIQTMWYMCRQRVSNEHSKRRQRPSVT